MITTPVRHDDFNIRRDDFTNRPYSADDFRIGVQVKRGRNDVPRPSSVLVDDDARFKLIVKRRDEACEHVLGQAVCIKRVLRTDFLEDLTEMRQQIQQWACRGHR